LAGRINKVIEEERIYHTDLQEVIVNLKPMGMTPWLEALDTVALSLTGQHIPNKRATLYPGVEWAIKNNKQIFPFLSLGLLNITVDAELDERKKCVDEIRELYKREEDNTSIRESLANGLYNITVGAELDECRKCTNEIRDLYKRDEDNTSIRESLAKGLGNLWLTSSVAGKKKVFEEIEVLKNRWPNDEVWKMDNWNKIFP
jgi:hypothetical protein